MNNNNKLINNEYYYFQFGWQNSSCIPKIDDHHIKITLLNINYYIYVIYKDL